MADLVHVKGLADLQKFLDQLPAKMEKNVVRGALRAAAKVVLPVAKANIHSVSGDLAASLKIRTGGRGGRVSALVYTRVFYAPMVEWGTRPHTITAKNRRGLSFGGLFFQSVHHPGISPYGAKSAIGPHAFMRPALDTQAGAAVVAAGEYVKKRLATKQGLDTADIGIEEQGA